MKVENSIGMFLTSISRRESNNPLRSILERPVLSHDKTDGIHARCPLPPVLSLISPIQTFQNGPSPGRNGPSHFPELTVFLKLKLFRFHRRSAIEECVAIVSVMGYHAVLKVDHRTDRLGPEIRNCPERVDSRSSHQDTQNVWLRHD